jgi:hypothetical protein
MRQAINVVKDLLNASYSESELEQLQKDVMTGTDALVFRLGATDRK